jgi:hypothetical protein
MLSVIRTYTSFLPFFAVRFKATDRDCLGRFQKILTDDCVGSGYKQVISYYGNRPGKSGALKSSRHGNVITYTKKAATFGLSVLERSIAVLHYTIILL